MKKKNTFLAVGILVLSMVIMFSSCKKKSSDPEPVPAPVFAMSSIPDPLDNNYLQFQFKCTTNDVRLTKVIVTDPLASFNDPYDLQQLTCLQNTIYQFNFSYLKATGKWTFQFTGNRSSDNSGFVSTTYLTVSK